MSLVFWRTVNGYMYPNGGYYPYMSPPGAAGPHTAPTPPPPAACTALSPLSGAGPTIPSALALAAAATGASPAAAAPHKWMLPNYLSSQQMYMFLPKLAKPKTERVNKAVKCDICNLTLNSELQAQQHYNGKNHLKKMKQLGMPLPGEDEGKKVIQQYTSEANSEGNEDSCQGDLNDLTQGGVLLEETDGCLDGATGSPSSGQSSQSTGPPTGQSGQQQTEPQQQQPQPQQQQQQKLDPVSQAVYDNILGKLPRKRKMEIPCSVCDMIFNSEAQASQHFRGVKHAKRLKMVEDLKSPSKTSSDGEGSADSNQEAKSCFYCHYCGVALNSPQQLEEHKEGQLHKKMVERKSMGPARKADEHSGQHPGMLYCQVCDISVLSQSKLQQHLLTVEHEERLSCHPTTPEGLSCPHSPPPSPTSQLS